MSVDGFSIVLMSFWEDYKNKHLKNVDCPSKSVTHGNRPLSLPAKYGPGYLD